MTRHGGIPPSDTLVGGWTVLATTRAAQRGSEGIG
jgi:hypothetical protein